MEQNRFGSLLLSTLISSAGFIFGGAAFSGAGAKQEFNKVKNKKKTQKNVRKVTKRIQPQVEDFF